MGFSFEPLFLDFFDHDGQLRLSWSVRSTYVLESSSRCQFHGRKWKECENCDAGSIGINRCGSSADSLDFLFGGNLKA